MHSPQTLIAAGIGVVLSLGWVDVVRATSTPDSSLTIALASREDTVEAATAPSSESALVISALPTTPEATASTKAIALTIPVTNTTQPIVKNSWEAPLASATVPTVETPSAEAPAVPSTAVSTVAPTNALAESAPLVQAMSKPEYTAPSRLAQLPTLEPDDVPPAENDPLVSPEDGFQDNPEAAPTVTPEAEPITTGDRVPIPEALEPSPNPLNFPTQPSEVEVVVDESISLEQAIALAERNNRQLQAARLELDRTSAALAEARAANLPSVTAQGSLDLQEADANTESITGDNVTATLGANLTVNYDLFTSGFRSASIRAARGTVRLQELQVEVLSEQLRLDVSTDYYDLQQADEEVRIAQDALAQAEQSLRDAQALEQAGVGTRFDVLQAQVDVANSRQELTQNISRQQIARRQLAQRLGIAQTATLTAADPITVADDWDLTLEESIVLAYRNRAENEQQLVQRDVSEQRRRAAIANLGPQVSVFGRYSIQDVLNSSGSGVPDSLTTSLDTRDSYSLGLQVSLNLFDGGASRARARQERINSEIAEVNFAGSLEDVRFQVEQAYLSLTANRDNIETTTLGVEQARESLRLARLRFQAGVGTQSDVLRAQTELTRAEVNQLNAILGYNRSLVALRRSVSNLPNNSLVDVP
ncbi:TolC family protein [Leptolyngbya sp. AN02str]|uniref:TolC family protein n=1 Tax=Leptolyngbya sp. AN02str TaxID=3423363 RepID=UPI003D320186